MYIIHFSAVLSNSTNLYSGRTNFILPCSSKNSTTLAYISCHLQRTHNRKSLITRDLPITQSVEKINQEKKSSGGPTVPVYQISIPLESFPLSAVLLKFLA